MKDNFVMIQEQKKGLRGFVEYLIRVYMTGGSVHPSRQVGVLISLHMLDVGPVPTRVKTAIKTPGVMFG